MLKQLVHNGIIVPEPSLPDGLGLVVRGKRIDLTPEQSEMALAWAMKKDTDYVSDPVFVANYFRDLGAALGYGRDLAPEEVDFPEWYAHVDRMRELKESLTKEERKALAAERKAVREALKVQYGHAIVDGQMVELGTYLVEPSGIFMGRGSTRCVANGSRDPSSRTSSSISAPTRRAPRASG